MLGVIIHSYSTLITESGALSQTQSSSSTLVIESGALSQTQSSSTLLELLASLLHLLSLDLQASCHTHPS